MPHTSPRRSERSDLLNALDEALFGVRRMVQHRSYRRRLMSGLLHDVELATLRLLRAVQRAANPPAIGEIADALAIDPSTASRLVDRAQSRGYVDRVPGVQDRRRIRIQLTSVGEGVLDEVSARRRELVGEITERWQDKDLKQLTELLGRLLDDFHRIDKSQ